MNLKRKLKMNFEVGNIVKIKPIGSGQLHSVRSGEVGEIFKIDHNESKWKFIIQFNDKVKIRFQESELKLHQEQI